MSEQTFHVTFDSFYYNSPQQNGLQITAMSPAFPPALRTKLREFMCSVDFSGEKKEERLVYCAPLGGFCKIFITHDVLHYRDYFYHGVTILEKGFEKDFPPQEDALVNRMSALLHKTSTADSRDLPQQLPRESKTLPVISADSPAALYKQQPGQLAKLIYLAFKPIFSLGKQNATFRFPADGSDEAISEDSAAMALFVLSVLPEALHDKVRMRFSADENNLIGAFDCGYCFRRGNAAADFDAENPSVLLPEEDVAGIFTAMGRYIASNGLAAYRRNILPVVQSWALASLKMGRFSLDLLYIMLCSKKDMNLPQQKLAADSLARFFGEMNAEWFELCAPALLNSLSNSPFSMAACKAMESNPLFNRTPDQLPADGLDPFFLLYAGLCCGMSYDEKLESFSALYDRYAASENGLALLHKIKINMVLALKLPAQPTPANVFEGMRQMERRNPDYAALVTDAAVDGYEETKDENWITCINSILEDPVTAENGTAILEIRCEDILAAAEDRKTLAWVCAACKNRAVNDLAFRKNVIAILQNKMISYEEFVVCIKAFGLRESDLPVPPEAKKLSDSIDSLKALAMMPLPKKEPELSAVQYGILERLCILLEQDCTWPDFRKYVPEILRNAHFRPTMHLHTKLEKLLLRQLTVLATDILTMQGGQSAYVELLVNLRRDFCLCLYPTTGAAAGKFNEKKLKSLKVRNVILRILPLLSLAIVTMLTVIVLYVLLPVFPAESALRNAVPAVLSGAGLVLLLLQVLLVRRNATAEYILPIAVVMIAAGLMRLLF